MRAFKGKAAIVTGGGGFLGRAVALKFAQEGAAVAVADINLAAAERVAAEARAGGADALAIEVNVLDRQSIRHMADTVIGHFKAVDILINNAGGSARQQITPFHQAEEAVIDRVLDLNLKGPIFCIRAVVEHMIARRQGKIINISSIIGIQGMRNLTDYTAAKAGIIAATKSLAMELGEFGINVNCVSPGKVPRPDENSAAIPKTNYLGKICTAEDVANLVAFLASPDAVFITGQNYVIDGGRSLGLKGS